MINVVRNLGGGRHFLGFRAVRVVGYRVLPACRFSASVAGSVPSNLWFAHAKRHTLSKTLSGG